MKLKPSELVCDSVPVIGTVLQILRERERTGAEVNLTPNGIEIQDNGQTTEYLACLRQAVSQLLHDHSAPVAQVEDPYSDNGVAYVVIDLDPCSPQIREVPAGTVNSFPTLVDAKSAAKQIVQASIARATNSLAELRQVGVERINYIAL